MILWSSQKLERALSDGRLESWAKVKYLIFPAVVGALFGPLYIVRPLYGLRSPILNSIVFMLCGFQTAYLTYRGIKWCFQANQQIDGKTFFERFTILLVPPLVRVTVIVVPLSLTIIFVGAALRERFPLLFKRSPLILAFIGPLVTYMMYSMVRNSFVRLGELIKKREAENS